MPERDGYIPGVPCWTDSSQPDPEAAVNFYRALFGWEFEDVMPAGSPSRYFIARQRGGDVAAIASAGDGATAGTWNTYVAVDSADVAAARVFDHGGAVVAEPYDVMDAGRMAVLADPDGAQFRVWHAKRHRGARIVNEPVSVVFNGLATRNVERARAFYAAVFGWRTLTLDGGFRTWTLPGYGDYLEQLTPGLRERVAEMGATPGFEDVVASLELSRPQAPAQWSVTFAVESADAVAERAAGLGATVVVQPVDVPWSRTTVISDPQGATFIASQFVPGNRDIEANPEALAAA